MNGSSADPILLIDTAVIAKVRDKESNNASKTAVIEAVFLKDKNL
jgi:hypothetical protein